MKKLIVLGSVALVTSLLLVSAVGCRQEPPAAAGHTIAIMVESNSVEAGSSFMVSASNLKPRQKIWIEVQYEGSDWKGAYAANYRADDNGSIHPLINVPKDIVPGYYDVKIFTGQTLADRRLLATIPVYVHAGN